MCRKNQLIGWAVVAFGLGLLVGSSMGSGFLCLCTGIGGIVFGFCVVRRR